jgi:malate synthase
MHQWLQEKEIRQFLGSLHLFGEGRRQQLLRERTQQRERFAAGVRPEPKKEYLHIRTSPWKVTDIPPNLRDRRVEITGQPGRINIINALNSGAQLFMADMGAACTPTWNNICAGHYYLWQAVRRQIDFVDEEDGKVYALNRNTATLAVRLRSLHLNERHINIKGQPMCAALFDTGLFLFLNAHALIERGSDPYLCLSNIENHQEAIFWADVLDYITGYLKLPSECIKLTLFIDSITAAFEMEEILHALSRYTVGMKAAWCDYLFSVIKNFRHDPDFILPDHLQIGLQSPVLNAFARRLVEVCNRRGALPLGGMSAVMPDSFEEVNRYAFEQLKAETLLERGLGFAGVSGAHPRIVGVVQSIFSEEITYPNGHAYPTQGALQALKTKTKGDFTPSDSIADHLANNCGMGHPNPEGQDAGAQDLLKIGENGPATELALRNNIRVGLLYLSHWLSGNGSVTIHNLHRDASSAELARAQLWQWLRHRVKLDDGRSCTPELIDAFFHEEIRSIPFVLSTKPEALRQLTQATRLFRRLVTDMEFEEFLTNPAIELID